MTFLDYLDIYNGDIFLASYWFYKHEKSMKKYDDYEREFRMKHERRMKENETSSKNF